jgi:hypothetical protein
MFSKLFVLIPSFPSSCFINSKTPDCSFPAWSMYFTFSIFSRTTPLLVAHSILAKTCWAVTSLPLAKLNVMLKK